MSIQYVVKDHVARVTIDRPDRMNAIDEASEDSFPASDAPSTWSREEPEE